MTEQLKKDTNHSHQILEGFLIPVIKNIFTVPEYVKLLQMFYGYYKPVEDAVDAFPLTDELPDYAQRRKAQLLLNDIGVLGGDTAIPLCTAVPAISVTEEAFGALYVLEGSTLGGIIITKILQRNLSMEAEKGFSFFSGYGPDTVSKWIAFKNVLARFCSQPEKYDLISATANHTFKQLKNWAELIYQYESPKEKL